MSESNANDQLRAIVVADGDVPPREQILSRLPGPDGGALVIAADGGALKAAALGLNVNVVVGDGDSLAPSALEALRAADVDVQLHPAEKDASDTELAVREALAWGATDILVLGALGGLRLEHTLANLLLLTLPELEGARVVLADGRSTVRVVTPGRPLALEAADGELVSLLPLSERVAGVSTAGLRYPLQGATLEQGPSRGLSNELTGDAGSVSIEGGRLAVVQTLMAADR